MNHRRLVGIDLGIASAHTVRVLDGEGTTIAKRKAWPTLESLGEIEAAALAGCPPGTPLEVVEASPSRAAAGLQSPPASPVNATKQPQRQHKSQSAGSVARHRPGKRFLTRHWSTVRVLNRWTPGARTPRQR